MLRERGLAPEGPPLAFGEGAGAVADGEAWLLVDGDATRSIGPALAWASRRPVDAVHVIAEAGAGAAARRAALFCDPPSVWQLSGTTLTPALPAGLIEPAAPPDAPELAALLHHAGLEVNVEHGHLLGELLGLEVARVVVGDDGPKLEVGVGKYDRETTALLHADLPTADALARAIEIVRPYRDRNGEPHPFQSMALERWLRAELIADPALVSCDELIASPSPFARENLRENASAAAVGTRGGEPVVVVTSVGIDLDVVPTAADTRLHLEPDAALVIAVPERDRHPLTVSLAELLLEPATVVGIDR